MCSLQVLQINKHLEDNYHPFIDMSDNNRHKSDGKGTKDSRSLAALAVNMLAGGSIDDACKAITDGFNDCGIDAIYYYEADGTLLLVQSKYHNNGNGSISVGDLKKFLSGVSKLIRAEFDVFNEKIKNRKDELMSILTNSQNKFNLVVIHSGKEELSNHCKKDVDDFLEENNEIGEKFYFTHFNIKDIYKFISDGAKSKPIDEDIVIHNWNLIMSPIKSIYGQIAGSDLANLFTKHGQFLFSPNIRVYLGNTDVNEGIKTTVTDTPELFWYFNNGITVLCDEIDKKAIGGCSKESGYFECKNLKIANGAQTVGTLHSMLANHQGNLDKIRVWARIIQTTDSYPSLTTRITRANNTQNRIEKRDFISLDPEQKRIANELRLDNIQYLYKSGDTSTSCDYYFNLTDATVARACKHSDEYAVQAKREISKLWDDINSPPYTTLFNQSTQGPSLYKEVLVMKKVDEQLSQKKDTYDSKRRLLVTHGNRLILHFVYHKLGDNIYKDEFDINSINNFFDELIVLIEQTIDNAYPDSYLASLFKNLTKCREVSVKVKERIEVL